MLKTGKAAGFISAFGILFGLGLRIASAQQEIPLWPKGAPLANGTISTGTAATDKPTITPFIASKPNGAAVVVFPGGAYVGLAFDKEGTLVAQWLQGQGISGFAVRYRYSPYHHPVEMWDAQRAIRWVRANAAKYGIDTARVGVLGFSAGGHLASTVSTHYDNGNPNAADTVDRHGCRPAFSILAYPVITMQSAFTHGQSRDALLGTNPAPSAALLDSLSNERQVTAKTPPAFLFHSTDDGVVPIRNPQSYYDSCLKKGVPATFIKFNRGGHGYGMADGKAQAPNDAVLHTWCDSSLKWLDKQGFLTAKPTSIFSINSNRDKKNNEKYRDALYFLRIPQGRESDALGRQKNVKIRSVERAKP